MRERLKRSIQKSKLYEPNGLSLMFDSDFSHQKLWNDKIEEAKHVQEQKKIDRIFFGILKERMFGEVILKDKKLTLEGIHSLDKMKKEKTDSSRASSHRKFTLKSEIEEEINKTIDVIPRRNIFKTIGSTILEEYPRTDRKSKRKSTIDSSPPKVREAYYLVRQNSLSKNPSLHSHFRKITKNETSIIYDIKVSKEMIMNYNKEKCILPDPYLERLMYFFNFPTLPNFKQYCNWVEGMTNCSTTESSFFVFQLINESGSGLIGNSDLFRILQEIPYSHSSYVEKEIYELMSELKKHKENNQINETLEDMLILNRNIKIEELRNLSKETNKDLVSTSSLQSTIYLKSMHVLEHDPEVREKNNKLEFATTQNHNKLHESVKDSPNGIRFAQFANLFVSRRPAIFMILLSIFNGSKIPDH